MALNTITMPILQPIPIKTKGLPWWKAILAWMTESREWRVDKDWYFALPDGVEIVIPRGFVFDGASVPRLFWWLFSPTGILLIPGLIHDFGYKYQYLTTVDEYINHMAGCSRSEWDKLFRNVAIKVNGFKIINYVPWLMLVLFGWVAWNNHRKKQVHYVY